MCDRLTEHGEPCKVDAEWHPVLVVRSEPGSDPTAALRVVVGLKICGFCRLSITEVSQVMTDPTWDLIVEKLRAFGKKDPRRELTRLDWTRLNSKLARELGPRGFN